MGTLNNMISLVNRPRFIDLESSNIKELSIGSTSKGNQPKYYDYSTNEYIKEQFYCQDTYWKDYMVEVLSSVLSKQLHTNVQIVQQETVSLSNGRMGCISKDFLERGTIWIPMSRTNCYENCRRLLGEPWKVFNNIVAYFKQFDLDLTEYLLVMIIMDYLLGNEDRHYGNLGVIQLNNGKLNTSPLFDFGLGLFEHDTDYRIVNLYTAKLKMKGKPFSRDLSEPVDMLFDIGLGSLVKSIFKDIEIPDKSLFPNELGYQYFVESFYELKGRF